MDGKGTEKRPYKDKGDDFFDFLAIYFTCTPLLYWPVYLWQMAVLEVNQQPLM